MVDAADHKVDTVRVVVKENVECEFDAIGRHAVSYIDVYLFLLLVGEVVGVGDIDFIEKLMGLPMEIALDILLRGPSGATTVTCPNWVMSLVSRRIPCAPHPSSLVIRISILDLLRFVPIG